ncbi:MAG: hypothetical protein HZB39_02545 [Planctomycetes bacterium]|nr:hypothetical protein [Planctomycetota bacterium]
MVGPTNPSTRRRRPWRALALGVVLAVAFDQLLLRLVLDDGWFLGRRIAPFDPPLFSAVQFEAMARLGQEARDGTPRSRAVRFDAELGWTHAPDTGDGDDRIDARGARATSNASDGTGIAPALRLAVLGCSFTYGTEVAADDAWPARLAKRRAPELDVVNLGVPGYGVDQALLRWRSIATRVAAGEVWLGFMPEAAARTVNVYRPALRPWSPTVAFKPRFRIGEDGALSLVPSPARSLDELVRLLGDQRTFLAAVGESDAFVRDARAAYAPAGSQLLHHSAVGRLLLTALWRGGRDGHALLADPHGEVRRVTEAIGVAFAAECRVRGERFRIVVLPDRDGLRRRRADGVASWDGLIAAWRHAGIDVVDVADALAAAGVIDDDDAWMSGEHYAPGTHQLVAEQLERQLDH